MGFMGVSSGPMPAIQARTTAVPAPQLTAMQLTAMQRPLLLISLLAFGIAAAVVEWERDWLDRPGLAHAAALLAYAACAAPVLLLPLDVRHEGPLFQLLDAVRVIDCVLLFAVLPAAGSLGLSYARLHRRQLRPAALACAVGVAVGVALGALGPMLSSVLSDSPFAREQWAVRLLAAHDVGLTRWLDVPLALSMLVGLLLLATHGATGVALLAAHVAPPALDRGAVQLARIEQGLRVTREHLRRLTSSFTLVGKEMGFRNKAWGSALATREVRLEAQRERLELAETGCAASLRRARRLRTCCSLLLLLLPPLLLGTSLLAALCEQAARSTCGAECGFLMDLPTRVPTPLDALLTTAARAPPADALLLLGLLALTLAAVGSSLHTADDESFSDADAADPCCAPRPLAVATVWSLRRRGSSPAALVRLAVYLLLASTAFSFLLLTLAPKYASHGVVLPAGTSPAAAADATTNGCSIAQGGCRLTALAAVYHVLILRIPSFGTAWYVSQWLFTCGLFARCAIFSVRALLARHAARRDDADASDDEEGERERVVEEEDDAETAPLVRSRRQRQRQRRSGARGGRRAAGGEVSVEIIGDNHNELDGVRRSRRHWP